MLDATPLFRLKAHRRLAELARQDAARTQEAELLRLVARAAITRFGRAYDFARIRSVADYQAHVPPRTYEAFWNDYWRCAYPHLAGATWPDAIPYYALSSGTTAARSKFIPVSREMLRANKRAALDVLVHHVAHHPESRVLGGKNLILGGSTALTELAPGIRTGDLSGIAAREVPFWAQGRIFPPRDLALIGDWDRKIEALAPAALKEDIRALSGTPSWLLLFFERLAREKPQAPPRLASYFPNLELIIHGGVGFQPYRARFAEWLEGSRAETREVYAASEGFIAMADAGPEDGMRLMLDNGLFYEFIPLAQLGRADAERHWIGTAQTGVPYALALTSNAGLFSYLIGDAVELVSLNPLRLKIIGRTAQMLSAFGEHVIGAELDAAIAEAAAAIGACVTDYAVTAIYPDAQNPRGHHLYFVEFSSPPEEAALGAFVAAVDATLSQLNADYSDHRRGGFGMGAPRLVALPAGAFAGWMRARGRLGGQNKVPRVFNGAAMAAELRALARP